MAAGLTWYLCWRIHNWFQPWKSLRFKDILPWSKSQMFMKTGPISTRIIKSLWVWMKVNGNWESNMITKKKDISRGIGLWGLQSRIHVGKSIIQIRSFEIIYKVHQLCQFHQGLWWMLKSPKTNAVADVKFHVKWNSIKNSGQKRGWKSMKEKEVRHQIQ